MMRRGFSLVEVLIAMAIIALVAAILMPVLSGAKDSARISGARQYLHQMHVAITLYRIDHDGEGVYSDMYSMGLPLPPLSQVPGVMFEFGDVRGANLPPGAAPNWFPYIYLPTAPGVRSGTVMWSDYAHAEQDGAMLIVDFSHNPPGTDPIAVDVTKRGLGVNLGGSVVTRVRRGNMFDYDWWK